MPEKVVSSPEGNAVQAASPAINPAPDIPELGASSKVEIREWRGRRVYIDGKPVGEPFDPPAKPLEGGGAPR